MTTRKKTPTTVAPRRYETLQGASDRTGLSVRSLRRRIADGRLVAYRSGQRVIRLDPADVDALFTPTNAWEVA